MRSADPRVAISSLDQASLEDLRTRYPREWEVTGRALVQALEAGHAEGAADFLLQATVAATPWRKKVQRKPQDDRVARAALPFLVRERMSRLALKEAVTAAVATRGGATGVPAARFGRWEGFLVQRLLFRRGLIRKPVSLTWFRWLWPRIRQRALLMPLVEPKGIYCFFSSALIGELARWMDDRLVLEIAAGDGTLARFLRNNGVNVIATDDRSWGHAVTYPEDVQSLDAGAALNAHEPEVVICSWPPPGNTFEKAVFATPSVNHYVVITTRHRFAAGAWKDYEKATGFTMHVDERLSRLVLPPEVDPVVLFFERLPRQ